jgi:hypothetical protein
MLYFCDTLNIIFIHLDFSPAGWDNIKKISILHENLQSMKPDAYYQDVIIQPATNRKVIVLKSFY